MDSGERIFFVMIQGGWQKTSQMSRKKTLNDTVRGSQEIEK
jgi:DTW domain-containing protein YfiP